MQRGINCASAGREGCQNSVLGESSIQSDSSGFARMGHRMREDWIKGPCASFILIKSMSTPS